MPKCSDCKKRNDCLFIASETFADNHREELDSMESDIIPAVRQLVEEMVEKFPAIQLVMPAEAFLTALSMMFKLGYYKGRTFPKVPEPFVRAFEEQD
jgi:hypothetical protein